LPDSGTYGDGRLGVSAATAPPGAPYPEGVSLLDGWVPVVAQTVAIAALLVAVARPSRRWWLIAVPAAAVVGVALAVGVRRYITAEGLTTNPVPAAMSIWIALTGAAIVVLVAGWRKSARWRKAALAVPLGDHDWLAGSLATPGSGPITRPAIN
jgi:hypothetical protein